MGFRKALMILAFSGVSSIASADSGTPEQQAACRPDVRRFCHKIPESAGDRAFEDCLQANHDKLSPKCQQALAGR